MISPIRMVKLGLPAEDVAAFFGLTLEALERQMQDGEDRRTPLPPAGRTLMTPLLLRPEMDRWETRRAER